MGTRIVNQEPDLLAKATVAKEVLRDSWRKALGTAIFFCAFYFMVPAQVSNDPLTPWGYGVTSTVLWSLLTFWSTIQIWRLARQNRVSFRLLWELVVDFQFGPTVAYNCGFRNKGCNRAMIIRRVLEQRSRRSEERSWPRSLPD